MCSNVLFLWVKKNEIVCKCLTSTFGNSPHPNEIPPKKGKEWYLGDKKQLYRWHHHKILRAMAYGLPPYGVRKIHIYEMPSQDEEEQWHTGTTTRGKEHVTHTFELPP